MSENELLTQLSIFVKKKFQKSRLQNADYRESHSYSPQWKALGPINYWAFRGRVYAVMYLKTRTGRFSPLGTSSTRFIRQHILPQDTPLGWVR